MRALALSALLLASACGAASTPEVVAPVSHPPAATPTDAKLAGATLSRAVVHAAVADGLGMILQHVDIDPTPVMTGGKFHGFRIASLRDPEFFTGVDLKPGDVVTGVNGFPIERPEQAQTALESLEVSSELRLAYDREGKPRELVYAIVDGK